MFRTTVLAAGALLVSGPALQAQEAAAPQLPAFAQKLLELPSKPFQCDLSLTAGGDGADVGAQGHIDWQDARRFAIQLDMKVKTPFAEEPQKAGFRLVGTGDWLYVDVDDPQQRQILKFKMDTIQKLMDASADQDLSAQMGVPFGPDMIKGMLSKLKFDEKTEGGRHHVSTRLDESVFPEMAGTTVAAWLQFDEKSGFPMEARFEVQEGEEKAQVELKAANLQFPEAIPADRFEYQEPEGVFVQDMTMFLEMMLMQGAGDGEF